MLLTFGRTWPDSANAIALVILPLPSVIELVAEQIGLIRYSPLRQATVTIPLALGLGRGFALYLDDQTNRLFWGVVIVYSAVCVGAVVWRYRRDRSV